MMQLTPWVRRLLIANVVVFIVAQPGTYLYILLTLFPFAVHVRPWGLVTYMFLHGGFMHLLFNMLMLFFFGPRLEYRLGGRSFLWLYFLSGLGGAVFSFLFARQYPVVGASAAVYGILLGFAMFWPRERIYIWGVLPVEAWLLTTLAVFGSLYFGVNPSAGSNTAHFAHLGGLGFAFAYLRWSEWRIGAGKRAFKKALNPQSSEGTPDRLAMARWKGINLDGLHEINREEVERLLAKVEAEGSKSLTPAERDFLDRMSKA
jgi:membrane associated rhomboid family serine protease